MCKNKKLKLGAKLAIVFGSLISFIGVILVGAIAYFRLPVNDYYQASQKAFVIPGLKDDFVPQGFCYDDNSNTFIISGYCSNGQASRLYQVDKATGNVINQVDLTKPNGQPFTGHAGGVACNEKYIYVAGNQCIYAYSYNYFMLTPNGGSLNCLGSFSTKVSDSDYVGTSFVSVVGNKLLVGEFYRPQNYPTLKSHYVTTSDNSVNHAIMLEFDLSNDYSLGISPKPVMAYSIPDQVQGVAVDENGAMYLSCSYGVSFSRILEHDLTSAPQSNITVMNADLPLLVLDSSNLTREYKIPPMSEEIIVMNGTLYVMCESASNKYIFGKFTGGKWCYATDLSELKK